jgi:DNA-directed RNA polymerase beta' subunit
MGAWDCVGHFGYIDLNEPIIHPLHYKRVVDFLRCFCIKCFRLLITEDQIALNSLNRAIGVKRFNKILEKLEMQDEEIELSIDELQQSLKQEDVKQIELCIEKLDELFSPICAKHFNTQISALLQGNKI